MAINGLEKDDRLQDREQKMRRFAMRVRIEGNATPANKVHRNEMPAVAVLRSQGKTADADAVEDLSASFTAPADATGIFGIIAKASQLGEIDRIVEISAVSLDGSTNAVTALSCGGAQAGLSPAGNVAIEIDSSANLASADLDILVVLEYYLK